MTDEKKFQLAVFYVNNSFAQEQYGDSGRTLSNEDKLNCYKYFKQATLGDNDTPKPSFINLVAKAKWNAWDSVKGLSKDKAMEEYVKILTALAPEWEQYQGDAFLAEKKKLGL